MVARASRLVVCQGQDTRQSTRTQRGQRMGEAG